MGKGGHGIFLSRSETQSGLCFSQMTLSVTEYGIVERKA